MQTPSIQMSPSSKVAELKPAEMSPVKPKANPLSTEMRQIMTQNPILRKHAGLARDVKLLLGLKHKLHRHRCGRGRGPKRGRRARRQKMQRRMGRLVGQLMNRLGRLMMHHQKQGATQAQGTNSGNDMSFLNDPKLSMNDKVELFLQKIIKDSESKIEQLMKKHESQGNSSGQGKSNFGSKIMGLISKAAPIVAGIVGGPVAGMAAKAIGSAVSGGADSSTEASKSSSDSDQRMTMLKIQKLQDHVKQMFDFFSNSTKKQSDLLGNIIRNMA